jgi:hypothetical protein
VSIGVDRRWRAADHRAVPTIRDVAEDAFAYIEGPEIEFARRGEFVLRNAPTPHPQYGQVLRPRLDDVERAIASARKWFRNRNRDTFTWWVSDASLPADLVERLLAAGAEPDPHDPVYAGMVLTKPPEPVDGVEIRKAAGFDDHRLGVDLAWRSFGFTEEQIAETRPRIRQLYENFSAMDAEGFMAFVDGELVGSGAAAYLPCGIYLMGGNVAEEARGRGVYRALVRARWDEAAARGTPALIVQAGRMSRPILERIGFETLCTGHVLVDSTRAGEESG